MGGDAGQGGDGLLGQDHVHGPFHRTVGVAAGGAVAGLALCAGHAGPLLGNVDGLLGPPAVWGRLLVSR